MDYVGHDVDRHRYNIVKERRSDEVGVRHLLLIEDGDALLGSECVQLVVELHSHTSLLVFLVVRKHLNLADELVE